MTSSKITPEMFTVTDLNFSSDTGHRSGQFGVVVILEKDSLIPLGYGRTMTWCRARFILDLVRPNGWKFNHLGYTLEDSKELTDSQRSAVVKVVTQAVELKYGRGHDLPDSALRDAIVADTHRRKENAIDSHNREMEKITQSHLASLAAIGEK